MVIVGGEPSSSEFWHTRKIGGARPFSFPPLSLSPANTCSCSSVHKRPIQNEKGESHTYLFLCRLPQAEPPYGTYTRYTHIRISAYQLPIVRCAYHPRACMCSWYRSSKPQREGITLSLYKINHAHNMRYADMRILLAHLMIGTVCERRCILPFSTVSGVQRPSLPSFSSTTSPH